MPLHHQVARNLKVVTLSLLRALDLGAPASRCSKERLRSPGRLNTIRKGRRRLPTAAWYSKCPRNAPCPGVALRI
eukprot:3315233-Alexandrium_andersonii.AAC.1